MGPAPRISAGTAPEAGAPGRCRARRLVPVWVIGVGCKKGGHGFVYMPANCSASPHSLPSRLTYRTALVLCLTRSLPASAVATAHRALTESSSPLTAARQGESSSRARPGPVSRPAAASAPASAAPAPLTERFPSASAAATHSSAESTSNRSFFGPAWPAWSCCWHEKTPARACRQARRRGAVWACARPSGSAVTTEASASHMPATALALRER